MAQHPLFNNLSTDASTIHLLAQKANTDYWITNETASPQHSVHPEFLMFARVCACLSVLCGFLGNVLTIATIARTKKLRDNANNVFVCNMSVSDGLFCVIVLPFSAVLYDAGNTTDVAPFSATFCEWLAFFKFAFTCMSLVSLCAIALNRYIYLLHPHLQARIFTSANVVAIIAVGWFISIALTILPVVHLWGTYAYDGRVHSCTFARDRSSGSYRIFIVSLSLFVPFAFMAVCYSRVCCRVYAARRPMRKWKSSRSNRSSKSANAARCENLQLTTTMVLIFLVHVVSCLPYTCVGILDPNVHYPVFHIVTPTIAWLQFVLNPFIYTIANTQFRNAYKDVLMAVFCRTSKTTRGTEEASAILSRQNGSVSDNKPILLLTTYATHHGVSLKPSYHETNI